MKLPQTRQASALHGNLLPLVPTSHHKARVHSSLPPSRAFGKALLSDTAQVPKMKKAKANSILALEDFCLPPIDDASVRTPPAWSPPGLIEGSSPKVTFKLPEVAFNLPAAVCESESTCSSPMKSPGRVGKVFRELLPVTPRSSSQKPTKRVRRHRSSIADHGLRMLRQLSGTIRPKVPKQRKFMSLAELRRHLLHRYHSLPKAFREMDNHIALCNHEEAVFETSLQLADFTQMMALCGVNAQDALHLFTLMDQNRDGYIGLERIKSVLLQMPADLLLQDFRKRLLTKSSSIHEAVSKVFSTPGQSTKFIEGSRSFSRKLFASHLSRVAIAEEDASLLFDIFDTDSSGLVSVEELQEGLREVAPPVSLEEFWQRFNSRWPSIRAAARNGPAGRRRATELIFEVLPAKFNRTSADLPLAFTLGLSADAWEVFCMQLDVSPTNGKELFMQCATAKTWQGRRATEKTWQVHSEHPVPKQVKLLLPVLAGHIEELQAECDLEDFFDELLLWSQTPLARQGAGMHQSYGKDVARRLGFMKTQVSAV